MLYFSVTFTFFFNNFYGRLRAARVLLIGVSGLGAEVAKNIVLSGIKSLTLLDSSKVGIDYISWFLVCQLKYGNVWQYKNLFYLIISKLELS